MGPVAASILTMKPLLKYRPSLVAMAGICAGIPGKAEIGDVIATEISWDWQSGKYVDNNGTEGFQIAPHQLGVHDACRNALWMLKRDEEFWRSLAPKALDAKVKQPKLVLGPMATGSSVLADARVADRIKENQHKNVAGLDMETYGVFAAAQAYSADTKVISLKSVCDKGDIKKNNRYQSYAASVAALTLHRFLSVHLNTLLD
jgi:nucleoside phosphorylase